MSCIRGWVGGRGRGGEGGRGFSKPETQAAYLSAQELIETATVGLDHGKGRGGRRGPLVPQCHLINAQQYPHKFLMALVSRQKPSVKADLATYGYINTVSG